MLWGLEWTRGADHRLLQYKNAFEYEGNLLNLPVCTGHDKCSSLVALFGSFLFENIKSTSYSTQEIIARLRQVIFVVVQNFYIILLCLEPKVHNKQLLLIYTEEIIYLNLAKSVLMSEILIYTAVPSGCIFHIFYSAEQHFLNCFLNLFLNLLKDLPIHKHSSHTSMQSSKSEFGIKL